jgi:hypothetical protein
MIRHGIASKAPLLHRLYVQASIPYASAIIKVQVILILRARSWSVASTWPCRPVQDAFELNGEPSAEGWCRLFLVSYPYDLKDARGWMSLLPKDILEV